MDKRLMGLLGAVGALVGTLGTTPAPAAPWAPSAGMVLQARSYAEPLRPVPEALANLQGLDEAGPGVELVQQYRGYGGRRYTRRRRPPYHRPRRR